MGHSLLGTLQFEKKIESDKSNVLLLFGMLVLFYDSVKLAILAFFNDDSSVAVALEPSISYSASIASEYHVIEVLVSIVAVTIINAIWKRVSMKEV